MKFDNKITVEGRRSDIELDKVDSGSGYQVYRDRLGSIWWLAEDEIQNKENGGQIWSDWKVVPKQVAEILIDKLKDNDK